MRRWWTAFWSTCDGLAWGIRHETAIREEAIAIVLAIPAAFLLTSEGWLRIALIGSVALLLITELLNTSVEKLSDRLTEETDPAIKVVKDLGSAAVFVALLLAAAVWLMALWALLLP